MANPFNQLPRLQIIRAKGTMLGKIIIGDDLVEDDLPFVNPNTTNLVAEVSTKVSMQLVWFTDKMSMVVIVILPHGIPPKQVRLGWVGLG